jgi:dUTP pyrophosphatase
MSIKIKKLFDDVKTPHRGTDGSAGFDIYAHRRLSDAEMLSALNAKHWGHIGPLMGYGTGLAFEPPPGFWLDFRPRSSIFRTFMALSNGCGTIDSDFRGEVLAFFYAFGAASPYQPGDRIGQIILMRDYRPGIDVVDDLSETGRGVNGYGSTGK